MSSAIYNSLEQFDNAPNDNVAKCFHSLTSVMSFSSPLQSPTCVSMQKLKSPLSIPRSFPYLPIQVRNCLYAVSDSSDCASYQDEEPENNRNLVVTELNENDVLCGRGKGPNNLIGNRRFRALIKDYRLKYLASKSRVQKSDICRGIVRCINAREPAGRFLEEVSLDDGIKQWRCIDERKAMNKTSQALREGITKKMLVEAKDRTKTVPVVTFSSKHDRFHSDYLSREPERREIGADNNRQRNCNDVDTSKLQNNHMMAGVKSCHKLPLKRRFLLRMEKAL